MNTEQVPVVRSLVETPFNWHFVVDLPEHYNKTEAQEARAKYEAAPEMYEALKKALETIKLLAEETNYQSVRWVNEHITPIEDVLFKATF